MSDSSSNNSNIQETGDGRMPFVHSLPVSVNYHSSTEGSSGLHLLTIERQVQELKNTNRVDQQNFEKISKELSIMKLSLGKAEGKLGPLQKMLASLTDRTLSTKKDLTDIDQAYKSKNEEMMKLVKDCQNEIQDMKTKIIDLTRKVNSNSSQRSDFQSNSNGTIPENLQEILEPYDRQLGMYDVRIAELDARFQVLESTSYTGVLVWKIRDYHRRRAEAVSGKTLSLYSQPFYTSRYGYKMCARIYLNGDGMGKGTHMSLFFVVMKGEYDALLPWPFRQKVTLMLLDQGSDRRHLSDTFRPDPSSSSFKRPTSDMNIASGCPLFVAHNVVEGSSYAKDDTIFLRIVVDKSDLDVF